MLSSSNASDEIYHLIRVTISTFCIVETCPFSHVISNWGGVRGEGDTLRSCNYPVS